MSFYQSFSRFCVLGINEKCSLHKYGKNKAHRNYVFITMHDIDFRSDGSLKFNLFSSNYRCMFVHEMITRLSSTVLPKKNITDGQIITTTDNRDNIRRLKTQITSIYSELSRVRVAGQLI